ncbi:MAG TPA: J domain-containing protein [Candidatus Limnocylindria bacterium]|nr:J domain-containing protein [Candidatus Limnocylindria bacterium]
MDLQLLPYSPERDAYRLLQVDPRASGDEIVAACRRLARTFHPDRNESPRAHLEMQVVNVVRRMLTDPATRAEYDIERLRFLSQAYRAAPPVGIRPSPATRRWRRRRSRQLLALSVPLPKNLRAAWVGLRTTVAALAPARCARCRTVIDAADVYCAVCGNRLLTTRG